MHIESYFLKSFNEKEYNQQKVHMKCSILACFSKKSAFGVLFPAAAKVERPRMSIFFIFFIVLTVVLLFSIHKYHEMFMQRAISRLSA